MKYIHIIFLLIQSLFLEASLSISQEQAEKIGLQIWKNECSGTTMGLTWWNEGEKFASLGIGHFIWFPLSHQEPFTETFPQLLLFLKEHQVSLPSWLEEAKGCPWTSRTQFLDELSSPKMTDLRNLLLETIGLQALFMAQRLENVLPKIKLGLSDEEQERISRQFYRIAHAPNGPYVLIDYLNFKGEGVNLKETYAGQGWGLKQVLLTMKSSEQPDPIEEFILAAKKVLSLRVSHAPSERNEQRWLNGWYNRLDSYKY